MLPKIVVVVLLLAIVLTLLASMVFLVRDPSQKKRTLLLLKIRVALSVTLVAFVLYAWFMGWMQPHGLIPNR